MTLRLPELEHLEAILEPAGKLFRTEVLGVVKAKSGEDFPVYGISIGTQDPQKPSIGVFGGVHGLERIGSQLSISWLASLIEMSKWDEDLLMALEQTRIVMMPIVNPGGMAVGTRCNLQGVDLMRNAPVEAVSDPAFLLGGHRYSKVLPWHRGDADRMEDESRWLCEFVEREMFSSSFSVAIDLHSGFGYKDRLWYPYAKSKSEFPRINDVLKVKMLLDRAYPNHVYSLEAQSLSYTTHGDLWDYLFDKHVAAHGLSNQNVFLPWTLEMGSWLWLKKNPMQLFSALGPFNPIKEHRFKRTLRRHRSLLEFFFKAVRNYKTWYLGK